MKSAKRLVVAKAKKVTVLDPRKLRPDELAGVVLGPTGNLRAPTAKVGHTWLVGFLEEAWDEEFE